MTEFLIQEGYDFWDEPGWKVSSLSWQTLEPDRFVALCDAWLQLPGSTPVISELESTMLWLQTQLVPTTGLLRPVAELCCSYLPWWKVRCDALFAVRSSSCVRVQVFKAQQRRTQAEEESNALALDALPTNAHTTD